MLATISEPRIKDHKIEFIAGLFIILPVALIIGIILSFYLIMLWIQLGY